MSGVGESAGRWDGPAPAARAKVFTHGGSQAVRLPKAFRFEEAEVAIWREGDRVVMQPLREPALPRSPEERAAFWARLDALTDGDVLPYPPRDEIFFRPDSMLRDD